ncbi:MAG TPA: YkgJ family cysteine cluster protein, partial [Methyloversatilis sp.]
MDAADNLAFFRARHVAFVRILDQRRADAVMPAALLAEAFDCFDGALESRCASAPPVACGKGCSTCCTVRVTATAPEVLLMARHLREVCAPDVCVRLVQRIAQADNDTRHVDEESRVAMRRPCPFIGDDGACVVYPVRPLACRGHASHDRNACVQAASGLIDRIPLSVAHRTVRSLVQNAMQSALRDAGYAWASYELNHALRLALADPGTDA